MIRRLALVLATIGCASPRTADKQPFPDFGPPKAGAPAATAKGADASAAAPEEERAPDVATLDPTEVAKRHPRPDQCEEAARRAQAVSRERGWAVLRACVARGKFTLLEKLMSDAWAEEVKARPDGGSVLAKVIAARGGDVAGDIGQLRQRRVPIFSLATAVSHPELYRGRLVILRAEVRDIKLQGKGASAKLAEFAIGGETYARAIPPGGRLPSAYDRSNPGGFDDRGRPQDHGEYDGHGRRVSRDVTYGADSGIVTKNTPVETGLEVIARLARADPFFEPGRQFIVLGKFEGVRQTASEDESEDATQVAVVSIVSYFEPSAAIVE